MDYGNNSNKNNLGSSITSPLDTIPDINATNQSSDISSIDISDTEEALRQLHTESHSLEIPPNLEITNETSRSVPPSELEDLQKSMSSLLDVASSDSIPIVEDQTNQITDQTVSNEDITFPDIQKRSEDSSMHHPSDFLKKEYKSKTFPSLIEGTSDKAEYPALSPVDSFPKNDSIDKKPTVQLELSEPKPESPAESFELKNDSSVSSDQLIIPPINQADQATQTQSNMQYLEEKPPIDAINRSELHEPSAEISFSSKDAYSFSTKKHQTIPVSELQNSLEEINNQSALLPALPQSSQINPTIKSDQSSAQNKKNNSTHPFSKNNLFALGVVLFFFCCTWNQHTYN